jgi:hypothetical protein
MKAIVVTDQAVGTAGMKLVERPEPHGAGANYGDVIVQVHASGFTGDELSWPSTWIDRLGRDRTPSIPGHELAGVVTALSYLFRRQAGSLSTRVGYTGGDVPNATYRNHGTHAEAIEIVFDPQRVSYRRLLEFFFQIHDPTTLNRQGNDKGASYRSAIFYTSDEQRRSANRREAGFSCNV